MKIKRISGFIFILVSFNFFCCAIKSDNSSDPSRTIGFIIPSYVASQQHFSILREGIRKIRLYHDYPIIIINDHSPYDISSLSKEFRDVTIEVSLKKGRGEMNPYLHYYRHKYFDTAIIIHDSMHLEKKLEKIDKVSDFRFIRYFTEHRIFWACSQEPQTDYNQRFSIKSHDDLILHLIEKIKGKNKRFYDFCRNVYHNKNEWVGCFGIQTIITWNFLNELQTKTNILNFVEFMKDRRDRMAMESIFALACLYVKGSNVNYLIHSYDGSYCRNAKNFKKTFLRR